MSERQNVLHVENATMQFGGVVAVNNLSLEVNEGEIVALIGPNGAGKTTAFNVITGVYQPTNGRVSFMGKPMVCNHPRGKMAKSYKGENGELYLHQHTLAPTPDHITKLGIARTFQNIRLWNRTCGSIGTTWRPACPTASNAAWRLPGPWGHPPSSCCWTSLPPV